MRGERGGGIISAAATILLSMPTSCIAKLLHLTIKTPPPPHPCFLLLLVIFMESLQPQHRPFYPHMKAPTSLYHSCKKY